MASGKLAVSRAGNTPGLSDERTDLGAVVVGMRPLLQRLAGSFIRLETKLDAACPMVKADAQQLEQVLLSLAVHASDAMPLGGTLVISTRRWFNPEPYRHLHGEVPPGVWAVLRVVDTGAGLDDGNLARLLGLASSPPPSPGAGGLDLSKVAMVVSAQGGHVIVENRGEYGTSIAVCLPAFESPPIEELDARGAVLVVDPDAWIRTSTTRILRRAGLGALQAEHAGAALDILHGVVGSCIRLMLLDIDAPQSGGRALAAEFRARRPRMEVVLLSRARAGITEDLLTKPFSAEDLLAVVSRRLDIALAS